MTLTCFDIMVMTYMKCQRRWLPNTEMCTSNEKMVHLLSILVFISDLDFVIYLMNFQRNSTLLILSMGHTITEAMTLEITSMNMQAMIATIACMVLFYFSSIFHLLYYRGDDTNHILLITSNVLLYRYPNKEEQYHFFRHYLRPAKPEEVCEDGKLIVFGFLQHQILILNALKMVSSLKYFPNQVYCHFLDLCVHDLNRNDCYFIFP